MIMMENYQSHKRERSQFESKMKVVKKINLQIAINKKMIFLQVLVFQSQEAGLVVYILLVQLV
jgi:hypothetical protein